MNSPTPVSNCAELTVGDYVEARQGNRAIHAGRVSDIASQQGLFWVLDTVNGGRKLLDLTEFEILHVTGTAHTGAPRSDRAAV